VFFTSSLRSWRRCFPWLASASILVAFNSGEAECITSQPTRTPTRVRALRALASCAPVASNVIHRRASRFVRSFESRDRRTRFKRCVAGVGLNGRACGGRRHLEAHWRPTGLPLSVCGAAPLRKLPQASSGSSAANIRVVRAWPGNMAAKHPRRKHPQSCGGRELASRVFAGSIRNQRREAYA
jgi:hypothetical protein